MDIPKRIMTRARKLLRTSGQDYSEEEVEQKAKELHQKYLGNKEKQAKRAEKRETRNLAKEHMITIAVLPEGSPEVDLPRYYAVEKTKNVKYKKKNGQEVTKQEKSYKLVNPLTKQRNIAQRKGSKPISLKRKDVDEVTVDNTIVKQIPLNKFVEKDQKKAFIYNKKRAKLDEEGIAPKDRPDKSAFEVKERGRPELLPKNIYHHQNKGTSKLNEKLGKLRNPRQPEETKEETHQEEEKEGEPPAQEPKKRGRPKKYQTEEEAKKAKFAKTVESNKRRRGEKRDEKKEGEEREAMGAEDRPAPAKKIDEKGLVEYYQKILAIHKVTDKKRRGSDMSGKIKDLLYSVIFKLEELGYETEQWDDGVIKGIPDIPLTRQIQDEFKIDIRDVPVLKENLGIGNKKDFKTSPEKWFKEQTAILRKLGVTVFDIGRFVKMSKNGPTLYYKPKGSGIMDTLNAGANYLVDKGKQAVEAVTDKGKQIGNTFSQIITGSTDYSPSVRKILNDESDNLVSKIVVGRTPVQQAITMALNAVSQGQFQKNQDRLNYDKLFHLFAELTLANGHQVRVEKNEVITMTMGHKQDADTERQEVPMSKAVSFRDLLENARRKMKGKFFAYDSANNNCQDFIMALLQGSGLGTQENYDFIKQNTKELFEKIPRTRALAKQITNLGQRVNIAMNGGGIDYEVASVVFPKEYGIPKARKWLKENHYKSPKVDIEENTIRFRQQSPTSLKKRGFTEYRTKSIGDISLILVYKKISHNVIMPKFAKGSQEARDHMAKIRAMRGAGRRKPKEDSESESDEEDRMTGRGTGDKLVKNLAGNTGRLADAGTDKLINMMGSGVHIHHHHHYGGNLGYGTGGSLGYSNASVKGSGPKGLKKFEKWTGAIGEFLKPVAKPILEAGTRQAVNNIDAYGNANANSIDPFGAVMGRGTGKGSQAMKEKMAKLRAMKRK
jgi:hypothetical protein